MSQENVEIVRRYFTVYNEQSTLSAFEPYWHPEVTWHTDPRVPEPGVYRGKEAVSAYIEGFFRAIGGKFRVELKEVIDLGGEEVLAVTTFSAHPLAATERETQFRDWSFIITLREQKVFRIRSFIDKAEALQAAGLRE